jgi:hypothetical protein
MTLAFLTTATLLNAHVLLTAAHPERVLNPAAAGTPNYGWWGYAVPLHRIAREISAAARQPLPAVLLFADDQLRRHGVALVWAWSAMFAVWALRRHRDPWRAALLFVMGIYAVAPGIGVQWLIWAVPFQLVADRRHAPWYGLLAGSYLVGSYWHWSLRATYHVASVTRENISGVDRGGVFLVGMLGLATWAFCVWTFARLARSLAGPEERSIRAAQPS